MKTYTNILIADPSRIVFEGLYSLLTNRGFSVNDSLCSSLQDVQKQCLSSRVDIAIINPVFVQNNEELFSTIKEELPEVQWIGLIYSYFDPRLASFFNATIGIYDSPEAIVSSIRNLVVSKTPNREDGKHLQLSEREIDVLKLLVAGNSNKEIADKLNISTHTVVTHRKNLSKKTGIKSAAGLTIYAVVKHIVTLDIVQN